MQRFNYTVKDPNGKTRKGIVEAVDEKNAVRILKDQDLLVISVKPKGAEIFGELAGMLGRVKSGDVVNFTRQLATMITAGLPLTDALSILEIQSRPALAKVIGEVSREIQGGANLADALGKHPNAFDKVYVSLIKAGESAGVLDRVLSRLADNLEKQRDFNNKVKGAMVYPIIIVTGMGIVGAIMVIFVLPKMLAVYQDFQAELPAATKVLLGFSNFVTNYWYLALIIAVALFGGSAFVMRKPEFRPYIDQLYFRLPVIGTLKKNIILTELTRTLSLLISTGILIVEALNIVENSLGNSIYEKTIREAALEVEKGVPLGDTLARSGVFPPILPQMVSVGEETGKLDEVLGRVSSYFEQEADVAVKGLTTALEPLIMIVLGVGVGFLIIAVIMPIYNLTSQF
jgi:type IV pilus assembly protein PilC